MPHTNFKYAISKWLEKLIKSTKNSVRLADISQLNFEPNTSWLCIIRKCLLCEPSCLTVSTMKMKHKQWQSGCTAWMTCVRHIQWGTRNAVLMTHEMQCYWRSAQQAVPWNTVFTHNHLQQKYHPSYLCECPHIQYNRMWSQVDSPPFAAKIKNEWTYISMPSINLHGIGRDNFTCFTFYGARFTLQTTKHFSECTITLHVVIQIDVTAIF